MFIRRISGEIFLEILPKKLVLGKNDIRQQSLLRHADYTDKNPEALSGVLKSVLSVLICVSVV